MSAAAQQPDELASIREFVAEQAERITALTTRVESFEHHLDVLYQEMGLRRLRRSEQRQDVRRSRA